MVENKNKNMSKHVKEVVKDGVRRGWHGFVWIRK